jgi:hypothetical protein
MSTESPLKPKGKADEKLLKDAPGRLSTTTGQLFTVEGKELAR